MGWLLSFLKKKGKRSSLNSVEVNDQYLEKGKFSAMGKYFYIYEGCYLELG